MSQRTVSFKLLLFMARSENQLSPIRTVSLKLMHTVLNPTAGTNFSLHIPFLARPVHGITECANGALRSRISLARPVHRAPSLEDQIKRCAANPNGYEELLNYQRQNGVNPLQCSVRSLFNVFHLPSNHKVKPTLHSSFCL